MIQVDEIAMRIDTLYSFRRCPYAMRARMALLISGAQFEVREVALRSKPAEMIAASAKATVPVLVLNDGRVIDQSLDIMRWALHRNDPEDWLTGDDALLIDAFDRDFKFHLDRYKYVQRYDNDPIHHRTAGLDMLRKLDERLVAHPNLSRGERALADIAIMPFVRQFAAVDRAWFDAHVASPVKDWLARHVGSLLFEQAMVRLKPWTQGYPPIIWPIVPRSNPMATQPAR